MGQYFKAVNLDKKEYVCPWCLDGVRKLFEWAVNKQGAVFTLLLRQSSQSGGGDFSGPGTQFIDLDAGVSLSEVIAKGVTREGMLVNLPPESIVGRWAGDRITLVGDYDDSGLYQKASSYLNISERLVDAWNEFVNWDEHELEFRPGCSCNDPY